MYQLESLNYLYQDIEPYIDTHTMALHYNKHAKKYLSNLNQLLLKNNFDFSIGLEELARNIDNYDFKDKEDILFNLGGVLNHDLYFKCMSVNRKGIQGLLKNELVDKYGSISAFIEEIIRVALKLQGSGYVFLEVDKDVNLVIKNRSNQDSPLFTKNIPLFVIDLWEHAYYINYENDKERYLRNFFDVADFNYANEVYSKLKATEKSKFSPFS